MRRIVVKEEMAKKLREGSLILTINAVVVIEAKKNLDEGLEVVRIEIDTDQVSTAVILATVRAWLRCTCLTNAPRQSSVELLAIKKETD